MLRTQTSIIVLVLLTFIIWVYKSSVTQSTNIIITIKDRKNYIRNKKKYLIEPNVSCHLNKFLVILVTSYVGHVELRSAHRRAISTELLKSMNATRLFLLAKIPKKDKFITQEAVYDESHIFGDILQGSFIEHYRNLTYKHLMGLQWASTFCNNVSFILKVDDDIVFNLNGTYNLLTKIKNNENFLMGYMFNNTIPRRSKQNKWYVTQEEYSRDMYPPYLSGWYYVISPKTAQYITQEAVYHRPFWIDDIFVTGILSEALGIKLRHLPKYYLLEYYELVECCMKYMNTKSVQCGYIVGPDGGRNNLIVEYNEAIEQCKKKNCTTIIDFEQSMGECLDWNGMGKL